MNNIVSIFGKINIKKLLIIFILLCIYIFISAFSYVNAVSKNISNSLFRLHVIANSDSNNDQNLKYLVRDDVLEYVQKISKYATSKEEVISIVYENLEEIQIVAKQSIINNGYNYDVSVKIGNFNFPTKNYGDISLPAGNYDALRVEIGKAERSKLVVRNVSSIMFC